MIEQRLEIGKQGSADKTVICRSTCRIMDAVNKNDSLQIMETPKPDTVASDRDRTFERIARAPLIQGNHVRLLIDAGENYPAWLEAIDSAERYIHFESYIIHDDEQGNIFVDRLIAKAREGVHVRLIYDWLGGFGKTSRRFWKRLSVEGIEVRCYNPFDLLRPLGWINRDHRKIISVDGKVSFVTGLCVGEMWNGYPDKGIPPWRDTGVMIRGKAVAEIERSFAEIWAMLGDPVPEDEIATAESIEDQGGRSVRVVAGHPGNARLYRLDQLFGSMAQETLWLSDAYFAGTDAYIETLRSAASAGVDVRLLVPSANDIFVMSAVSRSGYRSLLESGVRVWEWNGSMMHAKTAVIDGFWSRVGSTNLNISSWVGNAEIDVVIEDSEFGKEMQQMYLEDLANSTEIVLDEKKKARPVAPMPKLPASGFANRRNGKGRYGSTALFIGSTIGASIVSGTMRSVRTIEWKVTLVTAAVFIGIAGVGFMYPKVIAFTVAVIALWLALAMTINSIKSRFKGR